MIWGGEAFWPTHPARQRVKNGYFGKRGVSTVQEWVVITIKSGYLVLKKMYKVIKAQKFSLFSNFVDRQTDRQKTDMLAF